MKKVILVAIAVSILVGGGSFYGGMVYEKNQRGNIRNFQQGAGNMQGFANRQQGGVGGFIIGDIISKDDKSITVKLRDGGSKIIFYSNTTEVSKFAYGVSTDLEINKTVSVTGDANQDGSITAKTIQIRPMVAPAQPAN